MSRCECERCLCMHVRFVRACWRRKTGESSPEDVSTMVVRACWRRKIGESSPEDVSTTIAADVLVSVADSTDDVLVRLPSKPV